MVFYQVFLLSPVQCTVTNFRNCKRLCEFEEIEILRQISKGDCEQQGGKLVRLLSVFRPRIRPLYYLASTIYYCDRSSTQLTPELWETKIGPKQWLHFFFFFKSCHLLKLTTIFHSEKALRIKYSNRELAIFHFHLPTERQWQFSFKLYHPCWFSAVFLPHTCTANDFPYMYSKKGFSQASLQYQKYSRVIFPDQNYKDGPLNLLFPFLKYIFGFWDGGLAYSFWDH